MCRDHIAGIDVPVEEPGEKTVHHGQLSFSIKLIVLFIQAKLQPQAQIPRNQANTTCAPSAHHLGLSRSLLISQDQMQIQRMSDPTQPSVWPAMLPTFLFFGGLASAALLTQLIA